MESNFERLVPQISLRDGLRLFFRYRWRGLLGAMFVLAMVVVGLLVVPRTFMSEARIVVRLGRESVTLDPTASAGTTLPVADSRESEIQTALDMLANRNLFEKVVEELGPQAILEQRLPSDEPASVNPAFAWLDSLKEAVKSVVSEDVPPEEEAVRRLVKWISFGAEKRSTVIWVRCFSESPELSQRVLQIYITAYLDEHLRTNRNSGSEAFFEGQKSELKNRLADATGRLRDEKNRLGVVSIENERGLIERQFDTLINDLNTSKADLQSTQQRIESIRNEHPELDPEEFANTGSALTSEAVDQMRSRLYELQLRETDMASRYTTAHPMRIAIQRQVKESQRLLAEQELRIEISRAASLESRIAAVNDQLTKNVERLKELNRGEIAVQDVQNNVELLKKSLTTYVESREVARIDSQLARQQITNIRQVQAPSLQKKAVSPRKTIVAALGLMAAAMAGLGLPLASSLLDSTYATPSSLQQEFGLPVLMSIPRSTRSRLLLNS